MFVAVTRPIIKGLIISKPAMDANPNFAMTPTSLEQGHRYQEINISDSARVHLGNNIYYSSKLSF